MDYDVFDELFVFQKEIKSSDDGFVYNRYVIREPNKTFITYLLNVLNIAQTDKIKLLAKNGELIEYPDGQIKIRNPDTLTGTATIVLKERDNNRKLVSANIITALFMNDTYKHRPARLPAIENIEGYLVRWVDRMYKSFCDTLGVSEPESRIKASANYAVVYDNYVLKYIKDEDEIVIANLKNGKFGRAKYDRTCMFSFRDGIAIAWARLNNRIVPQMPKEVVTLSDLKYGDRFRPTATSDVLTYISKDPDSNSHIVKRVVAGLPIVFVTDGDSINECVTFYRLVPTKIKE